MARQQRRLFKPKKVRRDALERRIAAFVRRLTDRGAFRVAEPDALDGHVRAVLDRAPRAELWRGLLVTALIAAYHLRRTGGAGLPDDAGVAVPWPALSAVFLGWCRFSMPLVGDRGRLTLGQMFHTEPAPPLCGRPVREPELASPPDAIAEDARKVYEAQGWTAGPEHLARDLGALNEIAQEAAKSKLGANWMALAALALVAAAHRHRELTPCRPMPSPTRRGGRSGGPVGRSSPTCTGCSGKASG